MWLSGIAVCLYFICEGTSGLQWTSEGYLENGTSIRACVGDTVTLNWTFTLDAEEHVDTVRWHFVTEGGADSTEAIFAGGSFLPLPGAIHNGRLQYVPNAGVKLLGATIGDTGTYLVRVNLNKHGATYTEAQAVHVEVKTLDQCRTASALLLICENENKDLTSQIETATAAVQQQEQQMATLRGELDTCLFNANPPTTTVPPPTYPAWFHPANCRDLKLYNSASGVYTIYINATTPVTVYCDQTNSGGEWLVIQRRVDGFTDFYRNWSEYENGFGNVRGEFWLGLKYISTLTTSQPHTLRVEATDFDGNSKYIEYTGFSVGPASTGYRLTAGTYRLGTMAELLSRFNGMQFSTYDHDNDHQANSGNCAALCHGAWWYNTCPTGSSYSLINLNGRYKLGDGTGLDNIMWYTSSQWYDGALKNTEMKIRPST